jgi:PAS domain S-box-containing protein
MGAGELETTNAMLRSDIDRIADPIYVKDPEGRYLLVNPAAASATGLRPDQILGSTTEEERADTERRRLLGRLHDIQEEERGRVAVGLHDGPLQGLATLGFKLARARALLAEGCR